MDSRNRRIQGDTYTAEQVKRVLTGSGIDIETELDSDYLIFCPYHSNYRTPAGEVNKESGVFFCFSCQKAATLVEVVMHTSGRSYFEALRFIKEKDSVVDLEKQINQQLFVKPEYVPYDEIVIKRLNNDMLESDRGKNYMTYRKINNKSIVRFGLGYSAKQDMVTVPVHSPDGICVGFVGRSIEGKTFKNTPGLPKSKVLFNLHRVKLSDKVYIVESSFDAIRLDQVGLSAVATLGANISNTQTELLKKYFNNIIVIADNDEAGSNMKQRLIEKLGSRVSVITLDSKYKDIGDMDDEAIQNLEYRFDSSIAAMLN
jgi:DNA primase